jgi:hypothetical protein
VWETTRLHEAISQVTRTHTYKTAARRGLRYTRHDIIIDSKANSAIDVAVCRAGHYKNSTHTNRLNINIIIVIITGIMGPKVACLGPRYVLFSYVYIFRFFLLTIFYTVRTMIEGRRRHKRLITSSREPIKCVVLCTHIHNSARLCACVCARHALYEHR